MALIMVQMASLVMYWGILLGLFLWSYTLIGIYATKYVLN